MSRITDTEAADIDNWFSFHPPADAAAADQHTSVRVWCKDLAYTLMNLVPPGPERDQAIDRLREVMFWANAAIACNPAPAASSGATGTESTDA